jgi:hypothetical protein
MFEVHVRKKYSLQRDSDSAQPLSSAHPTSVIIDVEESGNEEDFDDDD